MENAKIQSAIERGLNDGMRAGYKFRDRPLNPIDMHEQERVAYRDVVDNGYMIGQMKRIAEMEREENCR